MGKNVTAAVTVTGKHRSAVRLGLLLWLTSLALPAAAVTDQYTSTISTFRSAGAGEYIDNAYGYAVFPTIGKGGFWVGGAYGEGRVYRLHNYIGDTTMGQVTLGFQLGGQTYSQMVFFQDARALDEFTSGNFEFGAQATAVALTAGAVAEATTKGTSTGTSQSEKKTARGQYHKGMAVFTIAGGGLMFEASIGGQKFSYTPKSGDPGASAE